jgi:hypothetical protein
VTRGHALNLIRLLNDVVVAMPLLLGREGEDGEDGEDRGEAGGGGGESSSEEGAKSAGCCDRIMSMSSKASVRDGM